MGSILERLENDHGNVSRLLAVLEHQADRLQRGEPIERALAAQIMRYMTQYQDVFHHPREDLIFACLVGHSPAIAAKVGELEKDHKDLARLGVQLYRQFVQGPTDAGDEAMTLRNDIAGYVDKLRHHMLTESGQVFPLARVVLSEKDWATIDNKLAIAADSLFGAKVEAGYRIVLNRLGAKG